MLPGTVLVIGNFNMNKANRYPDMSELTVSQVPHEVASSLSQRVIQQNVEAYIPGKLERKPWY